MYSAYPAEEEQRDKTVIIMATASSGRHCCLKFHTILL